MSHTRWIVLIMAWGVITLTWAVLYATQSHARDLGQYENADPGIRQWYKGLKQPDAPLTSCCDVSDCGPVEMEIRGENYWALTDFGWVQVPDAKVLHDAKNPTGSAVLCYNKPYASSLDSVIILCFTPGAEL